MAMTGHTRIARMQGSASLALEIMALNFLFGRVLIVSTGYYSNRLQQLAESAMRRSGHIKEVSNAPWQELDNLTGPYDWVWACPTETSVGLKMPLPALAKLASDLKAKLMLDATASIGLETGHDVADVIGYSSCKGLFGLTGASFIAFRADPDHEADSFYLNLSSHLNKTMTGPYHAIASLAEVLPRHADFRAAVVINKERFTREMADHLTAPPENQPLLCTHVRCRITSSDPRVVLYVPRNDRGGSVVCHLGEVHLGGNAEASILEALRVERDLQENS
jgi:2-aminoethylphosphonate-pyruvate transaminase